MSLFEVVSNDDVLTVGSFGQVAALASEQRKRGVQVVVRRATAAPAAPAPRGWAVQVSAGRVTDVLRCLDEEDALTTLSALRALGLRARIFHP